MGNERRGKRMAVSLRERPMLAGRDAERFLSRTKKNENFMKNYADRKIKEFNEKNK